MTRIDNVYNVLSRFKLKKRADDLKSSTQKSNRYSYKPNASALNTENLKIQVKNNLKSASDLRQGRKIFIECALRFEFGENLENQFEISSLVDSIVKQIENDKNSLKEFDSFLKEIHNFKN